MKNFFKKSIATSAALAVLCGTAFAAEVPYSVKYDYMNNTVTVSGTVDEAATHIALQVLTKGKSFDDLATDGTIL